MFVPFFQNVVLFKNFCPLRQKLFRRPCFAVFLHASATRLIIARLNFKLFFSGLCIMCLYLLFILLRLHLCQKLICLLCLLCLRCLALTRKIKRHHPTTFECNYINKCSSWSSQTKIFLSYYRNFKEITKKYFKEQR